MSEKPVYAAVVEANRRAQREVAESLGIGLKSEQHEIVTTPPDPHRLIAEGLEHDERMTQGAWFAWSGRDDGTVGPPTVSTRDESGLRRRVAWCYSFSSDSADAFGIAWLRNNARELLTGYAAALDDRDAAIARAKELRLEVGAHRAMSQLGGADQTYQDRSEFNRLKHSDVAQGKRIAELLAENERLRECLRIAGLQCFMRDGAPSEVAEHMRSVAASWSVTEVRIVELEEERDEWRRRAIDRGYGAKP